MSRLSDRSGAAAGKKVVRGGKPPAPARNAKSRKQGGERTMSTTRGRPKSEPMELDVDWIKERLRELNLKQADLAAALGRNPSLITRSLQGARAFDARDVVELSRVLKVSTDEILRRIGYDVATRGAPIVGKLMGTGQVSPVGARRGLAARSLDFPANAEAIIAETEGSPLAGYHGATFVVEGVNESNPAPMGNVGKLCVVEADEHLVPYVGTLGKGPRGAATLEVLGTGEKLTVHRVHRASAVLAIVFAAA